MHSRHAVAGIALRFKTGGRKAMPSYSLAAIWGAFLTSLVTLIGLILTYFYNRSVLEEKEHSTALTLENEHNQFSSQMDVRYRELESKLREELSAHAESLREELNEVKIERDGWKTNYLTLLTETSELKIQYAAAIQQRDQYQRETESLRERVRQLELTLEQFKAKFSLKDGI